MLRNRSDCSVLHTSWRWWQELGSAKESKMRWAGGVLRFNAQPAKDADCAIVCLVFSTSHAPPVLLCDRNSAAARLTRKEKRNPCGGHSDFAGRRPTARARADQNLDATHASLLPPHRTHAPLSLLASREPTGPGEHPRSRGFEVIDGPPRRVRAPGPCFGRGRTSLARSMREARPRSHTHTDTRAHSRKTAIPLALQKRRGFPRPFRVALGPDWWEYEPGNTSSP